VNRGLPALPALSQAPPRCPSCPAARRCSSLRRLTARRSRTGPARACGHPSPVRLRPRWRGRICTAHGMRP